MFVVDMGTLDLPEEFINILPKYCETCGSPMEISEVLTGLHCSNPKCKNKVVMRIRQICKDLGILNFGESAIEKFVDTYQVTNPLDMFDLKPGMILYYGASEKVSNDIISQICQHKEFFLWEFVMIANLPNIRTTARKLFQGYTCLADAYADIKEGGIPYIQQKLGISKDEVSIQAIKAYNTLMMFEDDLLEGEQYITIKTLDGKKELNVVCSDSVGGRFKKKSEFYNYVNTNCKGVHVNFLSSVNKDIDYLVWAGADGTPARYTSKVSKVERYNERGMNIPIVTAEQFIEEVSMKY